MKEELIKLIDNNDTISFDIFDTLLLRNIYKPTDIFRILDKIAYDKYSIEGFYDIRISSESESRTEDNNRECHYDDIYRIIESKIKNRRVVKLLKEEELNLEDKFLIANPFMKEIYDYCVKKKKKILIISDMYLDEKFIIKILKKNGYDSMLYGSKNYLENIWLKTKYPIWVAHYTNKTDYNGVYKCWQRTSSAKISGIIGNTVDFDICYK